MERSDESHCGPAGCADVLYFAISSGPQLLTLPVNVFRDDLEAFPTLHVLLDAGAPTDLEAVDIRFDGVPASCTVIASGQAFRDSTCEVPDDAQALQISSGMSDIAFRVTLRLERVGCFMVAEICAL